MTSNLPFLVFAFATDEIYIMYVLITHVFLRRLPTVLIYANGYTKAQRTFPRWQGGYKQRRVNSVILPYHHFQRWLVNGKKTSQRSTVMVLPCHTLQWKFVIFFWISNKNIPKCLFYFFSEVKRGRKFYVCNTRRFSSGENVVLFFFFMWNDLNCFTYLFSCLCGRNSFGMTMIMTGVIFFVQWWKE